jgi:Uma2 family endonuclease
LKNVAPRFNSYQAENHPMVTTRLLTAEDLYQLGPDAPYELIEGGLVEVMSPQGRVHGRVLANLTHFLNQEIRARHSGELLVGDVGFILARNPDTVLGPDLAYVRTERLANAGDSFLELAPDLAIEVISPSNTSTEIARKTTIYLAAGTIEVWVVRPKEREVTVHRGQGRVEVLHGADKLESPIFPKLSLPINEIF